MKKFILSIALVVIVTSLSGQVERDQIEDIYKWDPTEIFPSDEAWSTAKISLVSEMEKIDAFKGTLTQSATQLLKALEFKTSISKESDKLRLYASMQSDQDTRDMKYLGLKQEFQQVKSDYAAKTAFIKPEILSVEWSVIKGYLDEEPALRPYEKWLKDMFRMKEHTPGEAEGRILALSKMVSGVPQSAFKTFQNAEMPNPIVTLSNGEQVTLNSSGYAKNRALPDREDRALVFKTYFENLEKFQATYGELLYGGIKKDVYLAKARNYNTSLEAVLDPNMIPEGVYHALIDNVNNNLPAFHRFLGIKKRMMGLDTLKYLDLYAPAVKEVNLSYEYPEAKKILLDALSPLGQDYVSIVEKAINERWIDVYPSPGKRSGAYSTDLYVGHPYILLNYNDQYDDLSTAAHELGHTMHSYYAFANQPYPKANYSTFVAEVASTFNEVLLFDHVIKKIEDDDIRLSLLMNWLDLYKGTLFRQTQFAEFELKIHQAVEKGIPLTGEYLSKIHRFPVRNMHVAMLGVF